jgi:hypothetical protein
MTHDESEAHNEGEQTVARSDRAADERPAPAEGPTDIAQPFPSGLALRNATRVGQASVTCGAGTF